MAMSEHDLAVLAELDKDLPRVGSPRNFKRFLSVSHDDHENIRKDEVFHRTTVRNAGAGSLYEIKWNLGEEVPVSEPRPERPSISVAFGTGKSAARYLLRANKPSGLEVTLPTVVPNEWMAIEPERGDQRQFRRDLIYVMERLADSLTERQSRIWMESHNELLGTRPIDALTFGNMADVVRAVEAVEQLVY